MYIGGNGQTRAGEGNNTGMKLSSMSWNVQMQIMGEPTPHCALWILKHNHGQSGKHLLQYKILPTHIIYSKILICSDYVRFKMDRRTRKAIPVTMVIGFERILETKDAMQV